MPTVTILGRRFSLGAPLRLSDTGDDEQGRQRLVKTESPGHVNTPTGSHVDPNVNPRHHWTSMVYRGSPEGHSDQETYEDSINRRQGRSRHYFYDPEGNITAHEHPELDRIHGEYINRLTGRHEPGTADHRQAEEFYHSELKRLHDQAVQKGKLYGKVHLHPQMRPMIDAMHEAQKAGDGSEKGVDEAPSLVAADLYDDLGHSDLADMVRAHHKTYGPLEAAYHMGWANMSPQEREDARRKNRLSLLPVPGLRLADEPYRYPPIGPPVVKAAKKGFPDPMAPGVETGKEEEPEGPSPPQAAAAATGKGFNPSTDPFVSVESPYLISHKDHLPTGTGLSGGGWNTHAKNGEKFLRGARPYHHSEEHFDSAMKAAKASAMHAAALAKLSGKVESTFNYGAHPYGSGNSVFVADPEGNVTHHYSMGALVDHAVPGGWALAVHNNPSYGPEFVKKHGAQGVPIEEQVEEARRATQDSHEEALKKGDLWSRYRFNHPGVPSMYAGTVAEKQPGVMADWMLDEGHPGVDSLHKAGSAGKLHHGHIAEKLAETPIPPDMEQMSLQFGPALPWRTRSYHPKPRATDLREAEWEKISHFFPTSEMGPRNRKTSIRVLLNATMFRLENEIPLRELEERMPDGPPWGSCHALEYRISEAGLWQTIIKAIGRDYLLDRLPKLIRSSVRQAKYGSRPKVDVSGLPTTEG